ncbi:MAG: hypothetical protein WBB43_20050 [Limnoraphis sp.]
MGRKDIINNIRSYAVILFLHLIKRQELLNQAMKLIDGEEI